MKELTPALFSLQSQDDLDPTARQIVCRCQSIEANVRRLVAHIARLEEALGIDDD